MWDDIHIMSVLVKCHLLWDFLRLDDIHNCMSSACVINQKNTVQTREALLECMSSLINLCRVLIFNLAYPQNFKN